MPSIYQTPYFLKKAKKLLAKNVDLIRKTSQTILKIKDNPHDISLKTHKVITPKFGEAFSSRINGDLRIIWNYGQRYEIQVIDLLDIGGHSGINSVY